MFDSARIKYFAYIEAVNISKESEENHHTTKIHQMLAHFGCVISNSSIYKFVTFHFCIEIICIAHFRLQYDLQFALVCISFPLFYSVICIFYLHYSLL